MSGAVSATTLGIVAGVSAAGSIGSAAISAHAAGKAADAQSTAAMNSAQLQYKASQDALAFQKQQYAQGQQNLAPWLQSGTGALSNLNYLMGIGGQPSTPMQGQAPPPLGVNGVRPVGPQQFGGITGAQAQAIPGSASPIGAGMAGIPAGISGAPAPAAGSSIPGAASPISAGMQGVSAAGGPPATTSPVSSGMAGIPARSGAIPVIGGPVSDGMGGVTGGISANAAPVSAGMGTSPAGGDGSYGSLMQPWTQQFAAPTNLTEQNDPGYQARLNMGTDALQRSAAARGNLLTGGTAKALDTYAQDYASNEYGNVYNRAFNQYAQNYNQFQNNQANQYNRLASMAGMGQSTANQLGLLGSQAAQGVSSNLLNTASAMGQDYQNAGAANASGYVGAANAYGGALGGIGGNLTQLMMLKQLGLGGGSSSSTAGYQGQTF